MGNQVRFPEPQLGLQDCFISAPIRMLTAAFSTSIVTCVALLVSWCVMFMSQTPNRKMRGLLAGLAAVACIFSSTSILYYYILRDRDSVDEHVQRRLTRAKQRQLQLVPPSPLDGQRSNWISCRHVVSYLCNLCF